MGFDLIVANYNNDSYLHEFIDSIENSTIHPKRVIIVDDCSTDNSRMILREKISNSNLDFVLIENKKNLGFAKSLNIGINEIKSKYFARIDPDDFVAPTRFEKQLKYLEKNPTTALVGSNVRYVLDNNIISNSNVTLKSDKIENEIKKGLLPIIHGTIMGHSEIFQHFRYKQELVPAEDYDLFAYLIKENYKIENLYEMLTYVRIHSESVSNDLRFSTVMKRYNIQYNYFTNQTGITFRYLDYLHMRNYRKFLFSKSKIRYIFLMISALFNPKKIIKRLTVNSK